MIILLLPANNFLKIMAYQDLFTSFFMGYSFGIGNGLLFHLGRLLSNVTHLPPIAQIHWLPTCIAFIIFGNTDAGHQKSLWAAPIGGIIISTIAAYKCYTLFPSSCFMKGLIYGVHLMATMLFACAPPTAGYLGLYSLRMSFQRIFITDSLVSKANPMELSSISERTDKLSALASLISHCVGLIILGNPILATVISLPLGMFVKVISMRLLANAAIKQNVISQ